MINFKKCLVVAVISGVLSAVVFATCPAMSVGGIACQLTSDVTANGREACTYTCPYGINLFIDQPANATEAAVSAEAN